MDERQIQWLAVLTACVLLGAAGCGKSKPRHQAGRRKPIAEADAPAAQTPTQSVRVPDEFFAEPPTHERPKQPAKLSKEDMEQERSLADLLTGDDDEESDLPPWLGRTFGRPPQWDDAKLAAAGIRKLTGQHITIYTDLTPAQGVDELPAVFDLAMPPWCKYFGIGPVQAAKFRMTGYVIKDRQLFSDEGLLPGDLPPFANGYQRGYEIWVYEQKSDYYRRHLVLHEGTHGVMHVLLSGAGPPWYAEGMAELLATHRWQDGKLQLDYFPKNKQEVRYWGRIEIVQRSLAAGQGMSLIDVMKYGPKAHLKVEAYAWCWAAAAFLDAHPASGKAFRELQKNVRDPSMEFSRRFHERLKGQWPELSEQWQLFVQGIEYGYDLQRNMVVHKPGKPLGAQGATVHVAADRGWQSTGIALAAGVTYELEATGRYQLAQEPSVWWCEPNGVTIRYSAGRPLGQLLGAIRPDDAMAAGRVSPLTNPSVIGLGRTIRPSQSGTLYLRINDSPAELADNVGTANVRIVAK